MTPRKRKAPAAPRSIYVGLDFGTTYSGLAWAPSEDDINVISSWKTFNSTHGDKKKVLTTLLYGDDEDDDQKLSWGYEISPKDVPLKWFKLLLIDDQDLPPHIRHSSHLKDAKLQMEKSNRHVVEVVGDYIKQLWKVSLEDIEYSMSKTELASMTFHLTVTVPAIWPLYARNRMQQALAHAGVLSDKSVLGFVSEPEAAAVAVVRDFGRRACVKKNDHFVVCDAGGGTVVSFVLILASILSLLTFEKDLITYKCHRESPMQLQESVKGDGNFRGAICLDDGFRDLLESKLPSHIWSRIGRGGINELMDIHWENGIKINYREGTDVELPVAYGNNLIKVKISKEEISNIYKPIVAETVDLVFKQISETKRKFKKHPIYIVLVGGFGKSRFLYKALADAVYEAGFRIEILQSQGDKPWTAVCRGALLRGLSSTRTNNPWATVDARVARASYGTTVNILPWTLGEHDARDREWCPLEREFLAMNQVQWFIEMGETLGVNAPIAKAFWQDIESPSDEVTTEIVISTASPPPYRFNENVSRLCLIRWAKVPNLSTLPLFTNSAGRAIRQIPYEIRMVPNGMSLDFEIFHKGVMVASKNVVVECDEE
ncbi:hypothetical protein CP532_0588 [Ophiocordyceps camponoti-leonardi (nom. inval.)]|nr:hypothetical protein CP532_0588 [Ophiocordyceps camponoti-leonardi (nom. inval.)]